jgi:hypothetical protein
VVKSKARLKTDRLFIAINYFPVNIDHKSVIVVQEYIPEKTTFIFSRDFGAKHQPSPSRSLRFFLFFTTAATIYHQSSSFQQWSE